MRRINLVPGSLLVVASFLAIGCASVNYVGKSFDPTTDVDIYFSEKEIEKEYTVMGRAIGSGALVSDEKIEEKLIEEARSKGADAILITGLGKSHIPIRGEGGSVEENQINASFIKYE